MVVTRTDHIVVLHDMNACKVVDALTHAEPPRKPLIEAAIAKAPKCEVGECAVKLDPANPSGWIVEWHDTKKGNHIRTWCCDAHLSALTVKP